MMIEAADKKPHTSRLYQYESKITSVVSAADLLRPPSATCVVAAGAVKTARPDQRGVQHCATRHVAVDSGVCTARTLSGRSKFATLSSTLSLMNRLYKFRFPVVMPCVQCSSAEQIAEASVNCSVHARIKAEKSTSDQARHPVLQICLPISS